jgi:GNAT superfamily N-acetyltransferase
MNERYVVATATDDDVAALARRRCADEHERRLYLHVGEVAPSGAWVARDDGEPIGIAIPHANDDEWFLSELFVEPSHRRSGIGAQLLRDATADAGEVMRSGVLDPAEGDGLRFFLRRGLSLQTPLLALSGAIPRERELAEMAAGQYRFTVEPIDPAAHATPLAALDREVRGTVRSADHVYFSAEATGSAFTLNGELVGYVYVWPSGRVGPMASASPAYLVQFLAYALAALNRTYTATWCTLLVPGTNIRILRAALRAGLKIDGVRLFATDAPAAELARYVGFHPLLF